VIVPHDHIRILYFTGSVGYVLADGLTLLGMRVAPSLYLFLAFVFLIDAALYMLSW
jgi:hypothetical protein